MSSNKNSNEGQKGFPNVLGTEESEFNAHLNRIRGNLQTAVSHVKVGRRPSRRYKPQITGELEKEEPRKLKHQWAFPTPSELDNFLEDSKNDHDKDKKKEEGNDNGQKMDEKMKEKVSFVGVQCICSECGNSHISGDNAETGQDEASSSIKNRLKEWRALVLPDDSDE